ncbi:AMP-binding protein [Rhodanobacter ginsengisoli]|uniref:acetate--CoA ligase n=1 Tax=Rhodanobacter ginsengisoli TaxID=418646 RepID=A0ABW0QM08_9GAMM
MEWAVIHKVLNRGAGAPNLGDYEQVRKAFSWDQARNELAGLPGGGGINIAYEALDRHVHEGRGERVALRWLAKEGGVGDFSYAELAELSSRFASALNDLGVQRGERVFTLLGRVPALYVAAFGSWKHRAVLCPLFSAFGPEPIAARMAIAEPAVLVTSAQLFRRKVMPILGQLPYLRHVILVDGLVAPMPAVPLAAGESPAPAAQSAPETTETSDGRIVDFQELLDSASPEYTIGPTDPEDLATLHFTSGTTGRPKAAMHVHAGVTAHRATAMLALDLRPDDVYWCTADPGWVTGTSYGIIGPLAVGCTLIADEEEFDAERWYRTLAEQHVDVWYTAPTAIRMLMKAGDELVKGYDLSALRFIASVGEPLNPEAVVWGQRVLGLAIHDNWWQTETGGIMIANYASMDIKPGSMGRPLPGIEAAVVRRAGQGVEVITEAGREGELALRQGWPSMFRGYLKEDERYAKCFVGGWYLSGDLARCDEDGYFWFVGRADDVIKSAGHLIGPFEVESVLMEHPAVIEAGVIGVPDPIAREAVKAFVALRPGHTAGEALRKELLAHARKRLGPAVAPREIAFRDSLPRTRSGKIMRRLLKARELGLPEGDLSTLEGGA